VDEHVRERLRIAEESGTVDEELVSAVLDKIRRAEEEELQECRMRFESAFLPGLCSKCVVDRTFLDLLR
jgi:hypothetical protein